LLKLELYLVDIYQLFQVKLDRLAVGGLLVYDHFVDVPLVDESLLHLEVTLFFRRHYKVIEGEVSEVGLIGNLENVVDFS